MGLKSALDFLAYKVKPISLVSVICALSFDMKFKVNHRAICYHNFHHPAIPISKFVVSFETEYLECALAKP